MKDATIKGRKKRAEERVLSRYFLYLDKYGLGDFYMTRREKLSKLKDPQNRLDLLNRCKIELIVILHKNKIPYHWFGTFFEMLEKKKMNLPLHESIFLSVGDYQIVSEKFDEQKVKSSGATEVAIRISGKTKRNQIREFIELNASLISKLQELIELPESRIPRLDNFVDGYFSILQSEIKMSPKEITIEKGEHANVIKTTQKTISRYKKYLAPIK